MASSLKDLHFVPCSCAELAYPELASLLTYGPPPASATVGSTGPTFDLDDTTERYARHERRHEEQRAHYCPRWLRWLPLALRAWVGQPRFLAEYAALHRDCGFLGNPFEIDARRAEDPTVVADRLGQRLGDDLTPVEPGSGGKKGRR